MVSKYLFFNTFVFCVEPAIIAQIVPFTHQHSSDFASQAISIRAATRASIPELVSLGYNGDLLRKLGSQIESFVLIKNEGTKAIHTVTLRYDRSSLVELGRIIPELHQIQMVAPGSVSGGISPGTHALLTPWSSVTEKLRSQVPTVLTVAELTNIDESFNPARYGKVAVTIDSVILSDGKVVGPDDWNIIQQRADERRGQTEVFTAFIEKAKLPREELMKWLSLVNKDRGSVDPVRKRPDYYKNARASAALGLMAMLDRTPILEVVSRISNTLQKTPTNSPHR